MTVVYPKMLLHVFPNIFLPKSPQMPSPFLPPSPWLDGATVLTDVVAGVVGLLVGRRVPGLLDGGADEALELGVFPVVFPAVVFPAVVFPPVALHPFPERII